MSADPPAVEFRIGDSIKLLPGYPEASFDAGVTDAPYGLEFMGQEWDSFGGARWEGGAGFSEPGIGERPVAWPSFSSTRAFGAANPTCARCGGRARGRKKCSCERPEWKPIGRRRSALGARAPEGVTGGGYLAALRNYQAWTELWGREVYRVLKPGAHLVVFGAPRTYHRMVCGLEEAGFEIRDRIAAFYGPDPEAPEAWIFGQGFPKSMDLGKALARESGEFDVVGVEDLGGDDFRGGRLHSGRERPEDATRELIAPRGEAARWSGWGTALKPAYEPILVARKPPTGTLADNVRRWGTGGINIDAGRVGYRVEGDYRHLAENRRSKRSLREGGVAAGFGMRPEGLAYTEQSPLGRWPANVVLVHSPACVLRGTRRVRSDAHYAGDMEGARSSIYQLGLGDTEDRGNPLADRFGYETVEDWACAEGCPVREVDAQSGELEPGGDVRGTEPSAPFSGPIYGQMTGRHAFRAYGDRGGASRFYYCAKAPRDERFAWCSVCLRVLPAADRKLHGHGRPKGEWSHIYQHNTQKPLDLVRYLLRLVVPPGGTALDPFLGSGTTLVAAKMEGIPALGIERNPADEPIIRHRLGLAPLPPSGYILSLDHFAAAQGTGP